MKKLTTKILIVTWGVMMTLATFAHDMDYKMGKDNLENFFFMKAEMMKEHAKELKLDQGKVKAIKDLLAGTKKNLIKQDADIETIKVDIMTKLHEFPVDVEGTNKLLEQKYTLQKNKDMDIVKAISDLKSNLTKDQYEKFETIEAQEMEEMHEHEKGPMHHMMDKMKEKE